MVKIQKTAKPKAKPKLFKQKQKQMQNVVVNFNKPVRQPRQKKVDTIQAPPKPPPADKPSFSFSPMLQFPHQDTSSSALLMKEILKQKQGNPFQELLRNRALESSRDDEIAAIREQLKQFQVRPPNVETVSRGLNAPSSARYLGDATDDLRFSYRARNARAEEDAHLRLGGYSAANPPTIIDAILEDASANLLRAQPTETFDTLGAEQGKKFASPSGAPDAEDYEVVPDTILAPALSPSRLRVAIDAQTEVRGAAAAEEGTGGGGAVAGVPPQLARRSEASILGGETKEERNLFSDLQDENGLRGVVPEPRRKGVSTKKELTTIAEANGIRITGAYVAKNGRTTSGKLPEDILRQRIVDRGIELPLHLKASTGSKAGRPAKK